MGLSRLVEKQDALWTSGVISQVDSPVVDSKCGSGKESNTSRCLGKSSLMITSWNCRGLSNTVPYIGALIDGGSSILVLLEWL